ncbi:hypothetical protein [Roseibacillus ishigakijimensis]|uniref:Uncharacterized protein n=1 Tax=Roseibacillus ishigakijimensis TaxID=454146 RepID=A0A934RQ88_9BACT|nr:hypothetical protein [Roseibacillus ishigakijimensis]MBK1833606.1 hypothetical protein [Roseibacillus ishigakijimensis]
MKLQNYLYTAGFLIGLPLSAEAQKKVESNGEETTRGPATAKSVASTQDKVGYTVTDDAKDTLKSEQRLEALRREVEQKEQKLRQLREELARVEDAVEEQQETAEGNANHARDLIEAESDLYVKSLEYLTSTIADLQEKEVKLVYQQLEKDGNFNYKDKMAAVESFRKTIHAKLQALTDELSDEKGEKTQ